MVWLLLLLMIFTRKSCFGHLPILIYLDLIISFPLHQHIFRLWPKLQECIQRNKYRHIGHRLRVLWRALGVRWVEQSQLCYWGIEKPHSRSAAIYHDWYPLGNRLLCHGQRCLFDSDDVSGNCEIKCSSSGMFDFLRLLYSCRSAKNRWEIWSFIDINSSSRTRLIDPDYAYI